MLRRKAQLKMVVHRWEWRKPKQPNEIWRLDFIPDQPINDAKFRTRPIADVFNCDAWAIEAC